MSAAQHSANRRGRTDPEWISDLRLKVSLDGRCHSTRMRLPWLCEGGGFEALRAAAASRQTTVAFDRQVMLVRRLRAPPHHRAVTGTQTLTFNIVPGFGTTPKLFQVDGKPFQPGTR
jgi:hypothetical protein